MKKITKLKRSVKAISPIISVLLMIAIAVSAALVAYAWVSGYMDFTTTKVGKSIQIQSVSQTAVYVQNVGDSPVSIADVYVNGNLVAETTDYSIDDRELDPSETASIVFISDLPTPQTTIKIVTTDGISAQYTETFSGASTGGSGGTTQYTITVTQSENGIIAPAGTTSYAADSTPSFTITPDSGYHIASVTTNAGGQALTSPYVFPALSADETLTATFELDAPTSPVVLLNDGFEDSPWNTNWDDVTSSWVRETLVYSGSYSANADDGREGYFTSNSLDATGGYTAIKIEFQLFHDDLDANDLTLSFYNGVSWSSPINLGDYQGNWGWRYYTTTLTDSQYFTNNFMIRFNANMDGGGDDVFLDAVVITKIP